MRFFTWAFALSVALFAGMLVALETGFRVARKHARTLADTHEGIGVIEAAIFALLGLLLAFSFVSFMPCSSPRR